MKNMIEFKNVDWTGSKRTIELDEVSFKEDSDGLFLAPNGGVFGPEIMKDIEAAFDVILNEENPDED